MKKIRRKIKYYVVFWRQIGREGHLQVATFMFLVALCVWWFSLAR